MTHYRMRDREPSAIITVAGSEKKIYNNGQIFLNNGENFEIRFFNPLQEKIGVEIIFNGQKKNDGFLVLNPGQDVILDRFLGEKKKMKFDTYTIDGNNSAALQAAALNGLVEFKFHKERINNWYDASIGSCTTNWNSGIKGSSTCYSGTLDDLSCFSSSSISSSNTSPKLKTQKLRSSKKSHETGRVEKGPESDQSLNTINIDFESFAFHTINYQLIPNSQKPSEVTEVRNYCPNCGYRVRKQSWNFCPKCSEKF